MTTFTLFVLSGAAVFQLRIYPSLKNRVYLQYEGLATVDFTEAENNDTFKLNNGKWNLVTKFTDIRCRRKGGNCRFAN